MKTLKARLDYTSRARRDMNDCRNFLRRKSGSRPLERVRDILNAIRFIQEHPRLYPVAGFSLSGLELRRRKAGQFVILYSYFGPTPADPDGVVSIRAIPHASREDVLLSVHEPRRNGTEQADPSFMVIR